MVKKIYFVGIYVTRQPFYMSRGQKWGLLLAAICLAAIFYFPVLRYFIKNNPLYLSVLVSTFTLGALLSREFIWQQATPPTLFWLVFFNLLGGYFTFFKQPDILDFFYNLVAGHRRPHPLPLFYGLVAWLGFTLVGFYFQQNWLKGSKNLGRFILTSFIFVLFISLALAVIHSRIQPVS